MWFSVVHPTTYTSSIHELLADYSRHPHKGLPPFTPFGFYQACSLVRFALLVGRIGTTFPHYWKMIRIKIAQYPRSIVSSPLRFMSVSDAGLATAPLTNFHREYKSNWSVCCAVSKRPLEDCHIQVCPNSTPSSKLNQAEALIRDVIAQFFITQPRLFVSLSAARSTANYLASAIHHLPYH